MINSFNYISHHLIDKPIDATLNYFEVSDSERTEYKIAALWLAATAFLQLTSLNPLLPSTLKYASACITALPSTVVLVKSVASYLRENEKDIPSHFKLSLGALLLTISLVACAILLKPAYFGFISLLGLAFFWTYGQEKIIARMDVQRREQATIELNELILSCEQEMAQLKNKISRLHSLIEGDATLYELFHEAKWEQAEFIKTKESKYREKPGVENSLVDKWQKLMREKHRLECLLDTVFAVIESSEPLHLRFLQVLEKFQAAQFGQTLQ
ncbi:MAG: hypothetical protein WC222_07390 [Parachlamydiales bacterium]|jgi:hypothetical protein